MKAKTVVIDSHEVTRAGFRFLLEKDGRGMVVGEAASARDGYFVVERAHPDVAVVDLRLPDEDGIAATRELKRRTPSVRVLLVGSSVRADQALDACEAGATGVAVKHQSAGELVEALLAVARGETYLAPELPRENLELTRKTRTNDPLGALSSRERDIFRLFLRGLSNQQIAQRLFLSVKTVETHRGHIFGKLGVHSMAEMVLFAARHSLLPTE